MYGAGHVWAGHAHFYLHDEELSRSPSDETFIDRTVACLVRTSLPRQLWRPCKITSRTITRYVVYTSLLLTYGGLGSTILPELEITDQLWRISHGDDTHRVSPFRPDGPEPPLRCRRFAYGYALDGSECPSYLVWPHRDGQSYTLLDTSTTDTLPLNHDFFRPLGMQHFYDSFALVSQISVRREALHLFGLREDELLPDLHITRDGVLRIGLGAHQEHRVDGQRTGLKSRRMLSSWQPMRWILRLNRLCRKVMPVTLKGVKVRVTRIRMILLLHWWLMQNSMSSCKLLMLQWARTLMAKRISLGRSTASSRNWRWFQRDDLWQGYPFLYKHVWTTLTGFWQDVAGKFRPHVLSAQNHYFPVTKWRSV